MNRKPSAAAALAASGLLALTLVPSPLLAGDGQAGRQPSLRGAELGKLHDSILGDLLEANILVPGEPITRAKFEAVLQASGTFARKRTDIEALARDFGATPGEASRFLDTVIAGVQEDTMKRFDAVGAFVPRQGSQDRRDDVMRPIHDVLRDAIDDMAADGLVSDDLADTLGALSVACTDGSADSAGDMFSLTHQELGGNDWSGSDRVAADAYTSVLQQSYHFWSNGQEVDIVGGGQDRATTMGYWTEIAGADAFGGAVGAVGGGIVGGIAGLAITVATAGLGAPAVVIGAVAGAGAGGTIGSAAASLVQRFSPTGGPQAPGGGNSNGGPGGNSNGRPTNGNEGGGPHDDDDGGVDGGADDGGADDGGADDGGAPADGE